jgi:uncharacterized hydrophobic protein (TIGR00271 family)
MEVPELVIDKITKESVFQGANLWILVFAIFIASLGLNINSTAVIIGAMLISPLMGPIMGMGLGFGINDLALVKKAVKNYTFAVVVGLFTSFIYFSITPLNTAYSELLSRTSPTIYDVLIAIFGGLAGIFATSNKSKGNVIPGVAIATALMPPLCTAGYGLATLNIQYILGASFLFTINTVFIALSTYFTVKLLKFPLKQLQDKKIETRTRRIVLIIIIAILLPSVYLGYEMVQQNKFIHNAHLFIKAYSSLEGNYILDKIIDPQKENITIVYGGKNILPFQIDKMKEQLAIFGLQNSTLTIKQGFSVLSDNINSDRDTKLTQLLFQKDKELAYLKSIVDSIANINNTKNQILSEMRILYPEIKSVSINQLSEMSDSLPGNYNLIVIKTSKIISKKIKSIMEGWLKKRTNSENVQIVFINSHY